MHAGGGQETIILQVMALYSDQRATAILNAIQSPKTRPKHVTLRQRAVAIPKFKK